jgi:hypothetical protein
MCAIPVLAQAQYLSTEDNPTAGSMVPPAPPINLDSPTRPRLSPELALDAYERRMRIQADRLTAYTDITLMRAELTDSSQTAEYELRRRYSAPRTLEYTPVRFQGDTFVKSNVFIRLLQSEVDHVSHEQGAETAINQDNYKFSLKSVEDVDGHTCYVYHVKPRKKRIGLFKGRVFIDMRTGILRRVEGGLVKSPSWWVKKIDFVQEFDDIDGFSLPVHLYSVTKARVIGRAVVNVYHRDYRVANQTSIPAVAVGETTN